LTNIKWTIFG